MAIRGVSLAEREEFILPMDPGHPDNQEKARNAGQDVEEPTIFYIGNLTKAQRVVLGDMANRPAMKDGAMTMEQLRTKRAYLAVQFGLKGWENMQDHTGNPVKFEMGTTQVEGIGFCEAPTDECLVHLPNEAIYLIGEQIMEKNGVLGFSTLGGLEKNSEALLPQSGGNSSTDGNAAHASETGSKKKGAAKSQPSPE